MRRLIDIIWPRRHWQRIVAGGIEVATTVILVITVPNRWNRTFDYPVRNVTASMESCPVARAEYLFQTVSVCGACHSAGREESPNLLLTGGERYSTEVDQEVVEEFKERGITGPNLDRNAGTSF